MLFQRKFQFDMTSCAGVRPVNCDVQENETTGKYLPLMTSTKQSSGLPSLSLLPHPSTFPLFIFSLSLYIPALILPQCPDSSPSSSSSFLFQSSVLSALICDCACAFLPLQSPSPNRYEIKMKLSFLLSGLSPCLKLIPLNTRPHQWKA